MASDELFPIVDELGHVIGSATRAECHSGGKKLHPVVHLHVVTPDGRILLQKRSDDKDIQPGRWDTSVGGHVDLGESTPDALKREAGEELGLYDFNPVPIAMYVFESEIERELVNSFYAVIDAAYPFVFQKSEISEISWWTQAEIEKYLDKGVFTPNFEQEYRRFRTILTRR